MKIKERNMKSIFIYIFIMNISLSIIAQENTSNEDLIVAENYYNRLHVKMRVPQVTNRYIDQKATERSDVPSHIWQIIKDNIDYTFLKTLVIQVLIDKYTINEMQQKILEYEGRPYVIPIQRLDVKSELRLALQNIDNQIKNQINVILTSNGYSSID